MNEATNLGPGSKRERPATTKDNTDLAEVILRPYFEGPTFFVNWAVKPKDPAHGIVRTPVLIEPKNLKPEDYNVLAHHVDTSGGLKVPPGLMLRGESPHRSVTPGVPVRITIFGSVQVAAGEHKDYSYCRVVVAGSDTLTPCEEQRVGKHGGAQEQ
jgi:hypothetical protein